MIAITTSSSIRVKPRGRRGGRRERDMDEIPPRDEEKGVSSMWLILVPGPGFLFAPLLLPRGVVLLQELLRPVAEPGVAVAPLVADVREVMLGHAVAVAEDGLVGADLVEPSPHGR